MGRELAYLLGNDAPDRAGRGMNAAIVHGSADRNGAGGQGPAPNNAE